MSEKRMHKWFYGIDGKLSWTAVGMFFGLGLTTLIVIKWLIDGTVDTGFLEWSVSIIPVMIGIRAAQKGLMSVGGGIGSFVSRYTDTSSTTTNTTNIDTKKSGTTTSGKQPMGQSNKKSLLAIAKTQLGVTEIPGKDSNQTILGYAKELGVEWYKNDDTAWCALFAGWVVKRAGYKPSGSLMAKSYLKWGKEATEADIPSGNVIAVFHRGKPGAPTGHVGFVTRATDKSLYILGGNQSNKVNEALFSKATLLALRKPY
jgi:uncharacterized protein (TIGR02594 family)